MRRATDGISRTLKLAAAALLATAISLSLAGCSDEDNVAPPDYVALAGVFQSELPATSVVMKLYGTTKDTQHCTIRYGKGELFAGHFPITGMPLYALYDSHDRDNGHFAAGLGEDKPLDANTLRNDIKSCLLVARPTDRDSETRIETDD